MDTIRSMQLDNQVVRRGRKQKQFSKLANYFKPLNSSRPCNNKSFAESKRNTFLLKLLKREDFQEEFLSITPLITTKGGSNKKARSIAELLQNQHELLFRIKSKYLRLFKWHELLLDCLKITYYGGEDGIIKIKQLLDLIFINLGLTEEIESIFLKEIKVENVEFFDLEEITDNQDSLCYRDERESNRIINIDKKELFIDLIEPKLAGDGVENGSDSEHDYCHSTALGSDDEELE